MGRKPAPQPLTLPDDAAADDPPRTGETLQVISPADSRSPRTPRSPFRFTNKKTSQSSTSAGRPSLQGPDDTNDSQSQSQQHQHQHQRQNSLALQQRQQPQPQPPASYDDRGRDNNPDDDPAYPPIASALLPQSSIETTASSSRRTQDNRLDEKPPKSSGFFFNFNKSKSNNQLASHHQYSDSRGSEVIGADAYAMPIKSAPLDSSYADHSLQKPAPSQPSRSDVSLASTNDHEQASTKKSKSKPFGLLTRTKSLRDKDGNSPTGGMSTPAPVKIAEPERANTFSSGMKTAPFPAERSFRDMMNSAVRNRSEDRAAPRDAGHRENYRDREQSQPQLYQQQRPPAAPYKESNSGGGGGGGFFGGFKNSRAADMISKGLFGKGRSSSTTEKEPVVDDEHYVLKVINLPLVEQTRLTRISKRLEDSRDKTEFWMPAFPWRAIDYLNYKGSDVEGLYRVPGSGPQIKKWQRKFDEEYDVDLFAQDDLYDINIIGSMLKAWLRELPDELFPKAAQERIARECAGAETVPQMLVDELSNLSPFNYYLLFAITCHLSLLLAHADKNKMDFRNLCICFQPCMKIDAFCFKFLVCEWRDCWKGCRNEARYIEEEYMLLDMPPPRGLAEPRRPLQDEAATTASASSAVASVSSPEPDRNISSSDSSKVSASESTPAATTNGKSAKLKKKPVPQISGGGGGSGSYGGLMTSGSSPPTESHASMASNSTLSTTLTINSTETPRRSNDIRPLSPIKPLSPLGFQGTFS